MSTAFPRTDRQRLLDLLRIVQGVAAGELSVHANKETDDIVGMLAVGINMMIDDLREQRKVEERHVARIKHQSRVLRSIRNINLLIATEKDRKTLIETACASLVEDHGYERAWIALLDSSSQISLFAQAGSGEGSLVERFRETEPPPCIKAAFSSLDVLVVSPDCDVCSICHHSESCPFNEGMVVQIEHDRKRFGLLRIAPSDEFAADAEERSLFHEVASDLGLALNSIEIEEQRLAAEERLRNLNRDLTDTKDRLLIFEKAIQTTKAGITIRDCANKIIYANPADVAMHGYDSPRELIGKEANIYGPPRLRKPLTPEEIAQMEGWTRESVNVRKDGSRFPVFLTTDVIRSDDGAPVGIVTVCEDVSERKAAERQLRTAHEELQESVAQVVHSSRLAALGEMAAGVAHELNQPLNIIKLTMQGALRDVDKGNYDISDFVGDGKEVVALVNKMAGTIDHMRAFTRKSEGSPLIEVDVNISITNALSLLQEQLRVHGIKLEQQLCDKLPSTRAAPNTIEQVFLNLLTNARDAVLARMENNSSHDGRITITSSLLSDEEVRVDVHDNGEGVPAAIIGKVFDPFFTTKDTGKGTGLGLSISRKIVDGCGGRIEVDVQEREGTTFHVILPVLRGQEEK